MSDDDEGGPRVEESRRLSAYYLLTHLVVAGKTRCEDVDGTLGLLEESLEWEYSAPLPDDGYWARHGLEGDEERRQARRTNYFFAKMRRYASQLRKGEAPAYERDPVYPENCSLLLSSNAPHVYGDILLPHWQEVFNALEFYHRLVGGAIPIEIQVGYAELMNELPNMMGEWLSQCNLRRLSLWGIPNALLAASAVDIIQGSPQLEELVTDMITTDENNNSLDSLCSIIRNHPSLRRLRIPGRFDEGMNGFTALQSLIMAGGDKLTEIDFSDKGVNTGGSTFLWDFLAGNPPLKCLVLDGSDLDDNDARLIAEALGRNTNLRRLSIDNNPGITKRGQNMLRRAIWDDYSLNAVSGSNHTCQISLFIPMCRTTYRSRWTAWSNGPPYRPYEAAFNRKRKICRVLEKRNVEQSNVWHFENEGVTLKDIPHVLEGVQACSRGYPRDGETKGLSVVYEIMRGWEMPSLYQQGTATM